MLLPRDSKQSHVQFSLRELGGTVLFGNKKACQIQGIGSFQMKIHDGITRTLQQAWYVPNLKRNLLSIGMFDSNGFSVKIDNGTMKISRGSLFGVKGKLSNGMYYLVGNAILGQASSPINQDNILGLVM
uniref:Retrovirus-related Pol polyprotein from transposon TNT 1-94-like beta-barrel domain-containing protein n=1 Tax=Cannabis sativa TaxID=3483 RepID=A0A803P4B8_CANSA